MITLSTRLGGFLFLIISSTETVYIGNPYVNIRNLNNKKSTQHTNNLTMTIQNNSVKTLVTVLVMRIRGVSTPKENQMFTVSTKVPFAYEVSPCEAENFCKIHNKLLETFWSLPTQIQKVIEYASIELDNIEHQKFVIKVKLSGSNTNKWEAESQWIIFLDKTDQEVSQEEIKRGFLSTIREALAERRNKMWSDEKMFDELLRKLKTSKSIRY